MRFTRTESWRVLTEAIIRSNPISNQILGICSSLAVTVQLKPAIVMVLALTIVVACSNFILSVMRSIIPRNIRMIVELIVIATLVILADQVLRAFLFDVSKQLSVFVGLIITNCILMGRAEAFALSNPPWPSFLDGIGNGLGYGLILIMVAFLRELFGSGTLFGIHIVPEAAYQMGYQNLAVMVFPVGAFIVIGLFVWLVNTLKAPETGGLK